MDAQRKQMKLAKRQTNAPFAKRLATYIAKKGLNGYQFAGVLGIQRNTVYCWLSGDNLPDLVSLANICKVLDVTPNDLMVGIFL